MGRILDYFGNLQFHNEAEVSQNFLLPLLTEFLDYHPDEILPEYLFPAFDIPQNRLRSVSTAELPIKAKPDYVVTINGKDRVLICDSKGPNESLDDHLDQLRAYCIAVGTNLLLITNGIELQVYNANTLVFSATSIEELDLSFSELYKLLNRADAAQYTDVERIQTLNLPRSLNKDSETLRQEYRRRVATMLSDFTQYLAEISQTSTILELPSPIKSAFQSNLQRFPAEKLYSFQEYHRGDYSLERKREVPYRTILQEAFHTPILLIGESGIGKTSLLQQVLLDQAQVCREYRSNEVPVIVKLGLYSGNRSLTEMIFNALFSKAANVDTDRLSHLLRDGRLIILLDAFDEVFEESVPQVERDIQALMDNYPQCKIIITTRHFRLPRLTPVRRYEVQPLSYEKIEAFAQMYLGTDDQAFLAEVNRKGLVKVASNTLLLTLLLLLYLHERKLPRSRGQILQAVVDYVREWDENKAERFVSPLSWKIREELLAQLAFTALASRKSYALNKSSVETALNDALSDLEKRRQIRRGLTIAEVLNILVATGFILQADEGIVFWHRAFVEYFSAIEIARRIESKPGLLESLIKKPEWEEVLPLAMSKANNPSELIKTVLLHNVFVAGRALHECNITEGDIYHRTIDILGQKCNSSTYPIRRMALNLLQQLGGEDVDAHFKELLGSPFVYVQKVALVEIARRKIPDAHQIVFSRLDWDVPTDLHLWGGPSRAAVIEALGEFDDLDSHQQIINFWQREPDMYTNESSCNAFLKIANRGNISREAKQKLLGLFLSSDTKLFKLWQLSHVLIALHDRDFVPDLISALKQFDQRDNQIHALHAVEVLASFNESEVIQQLVRCAYDRNLSDYVRSRFAEALSKSKGMVPLNVFETLAKDNSNEVKRYGIQGLGRFSFEQVRTLVLHALHPPPEESLKWDRDFAYVQTAAFEGLAQYGQIELLLEKEHQPEYFFNFALEVLFKAVSTNHLHSMIPLLEAIIERINDDRTIIQAAWVLADLGYTERAQEVVDSFRGDRLTRGFVAHDILQGIHLLPDSYGLSIVENILAKEAEIDSSHYLKMLCIEALVRIGTTEACDRLAQIAWKSAEDGVGIDAELALRSIEFLAPKEREQWLLQLINEHPKMERIALRRALETLSVIGSEASLPLLQKHFNSATDDGFQATCFWAIQNIHKRLGQLWFNQEERGM